MTGRRGVCRDRALRAHLLGGDSALAKTELTDDEIPNRGQFVIGIPREVRMHEHRSLISLQLRAVCQHLHDIRARRIAGTMIAAQGSPGRLQTFAV
jgi:hypothetical protein